MAEFHRGHWDQERQVFVHEDGTDCGLCWWDKKDTKELKTAGFTLDEILARPLARCMGGRFCDHLPGTCTATVGEVGVVKLPDDTLIDFEEAKAKKRWEESDDPNSVTPMEALQAAIRAIAKGEFDPQHIVIVMGRVDEETFETQIRQAGEFNSFAQFGLLQRAIAKLNDECHPA
jgi:hypothetical protein